MDAKMDEIRLAHGSTCAQSADDHHAGRSAEWKSWDAALVGARDRCRAECPGWRLASARQGPFAATRRASTSSGSRPGFGRARNHGKPANERGPRSRDLRSKGGLGWSRAAPAPSSSDVGSAPPEQQQQAIAARHGGVVKRMLEEWRLRRPDRSRIACPSPCIIPTSMVWPEMMFPGTDDHAAASTEGRDALDLPRLQDQGDERPPASVRHHPPRPARLDLAGRSGRASARFWTKTSIALTDRPKVDCAGQPRPCRSARRLGGCSRKSPPTVENDLRRPPMQSPPRGSTKASASPICASSSLQKPPIRTLRPSSRSRSFRRSTLSILGRGARWSSTNGQRVAAPVASPPPP